MRKLLTLLVLCGALAVPTVAHAGCIATPGAVTFNVPAVNTSTHIGCTSNNGEHYQLRIYIQRDSILDPNHFTSWPSPVTYNFDHPPDNFVHNYLAGFGCHIIFDTTLLHARNKSVLENLVSGSQATTVGPVANVPLNCL